MSTISAIAYSTLPALFALGLKAAWKSNNLYSPDVLHFVDLGALRTRRNYSARQMVVEVERMSMLRDMGYWLDVPKENNVELAPLLKAEAPLTNHSKATDPHLPLPDEYVAEMGIKSVWLSTNLTENLVEIADALGTRWNAFILLRESAPSSAAWGRIVKKFLKAFAWKDASDFPITSLPFPVRFPGDTRFQKLARLPEVGDEDSLSWPPTNLRDFRHVVGLVQSAHYFIAALSMGARASEALSLERGCVQYHAVTGEPVVNGLTFKLVRKFAGETRDWPAPIAMMQAVERQTRLINAADRLFIGIEKERPTFEVVLQSNLWGRFGAQTRLPAEELVMVNRMLQEFAESLYMTTKPGGQNIRSHRFRKTLARLVALALTQAPKILMDIFGHKSIEMTLHYILSDPSLRAEIDTVSKELRIMMAKEVVEVMVAEELNASDWSADGYGGAAAVSIASAVDAHKQRLHRHGKAWGQDSAYELSELLTMKGEAWEYVRPGVMCTKLPGEAGICNKRRGRPEPANCQSSCDYRLEEKFLRADVDSAIDDCIKNFERAVAAEEDLVSAHWSAQLHHHLGRFDDLRAKWMSDPTVRSLLEAVS